MYEVIAESITGRKGKIVNKGILKRPDVFTKETLEAHLKSGAIKKIDTKTKADK